ncbi:MAG TPA: recombinase family protein [Terriglobales bacterium]|nr:recombinase family protein [Terriglobales bacterium]HXY15863.1 recombinase family protein [Terriglobales bacterium]
MAIERIRQVLPGPIDWQQVEAYQKQGWRLAAVEWERELGGHGITQAEAPPYGLRVAKDCAMLEENPKENEVLFTMMELLIEDGPYSFIAEELNRRGYSTRSGGKWSAISVFEMLPRLIDAGPKIFSTSEWQERRQRSREQGAGLRV